MVDRKWAAYQIIDIPAKISTTVVCSRVRFVFVLHGVVYFQARFVLNAIFLFATTVTTGIFQNMFTIIRGAFTITAIYLIAITTSGVCFRVPFVDVDPFSPTFTTGTFPITFIATIDNGAFTIKAVLMIAVTTAGVCVRDRCYVFAIFLLATA